MPFKDLEEYYKNYNGKNTLESKCKEKGCSLKDVNNNSYLVINGDKVEEYKGNSQIKKSVDCIIIDREPLNNAYKVVLCELTSGKKNVNVLIEKFSNSGEEISNSFNKFNLEISDLKCVLIGKIKNPNRGVGVMNKKFSINGLNVKNKPTFYTVIRMYNCGKISINDL